jgi:prevent-host-death family protein
MVWKVGEAKQRFSEVLRRAEKEPQVIQNRDRVVAVVMSPAAAETRGKKLAPSMRTALAELRGIAAEAGYELTLPARRDRAAELPHVPRRHERPQRARKTSP